MHYSKLGLKNTQEIFHKAIQNGFAVPAFNIYNLETMIAVLNAAKTNKSPVILGISESALNYMGANNLIGLISAQKFSSDDYVCLHLDHGKSFDLCKHVIELGFSSVMIDASALPLHENISISSYVAEYAHKFDVSTESEIGILSGIEDENTFSDKSQYTNPQDAKTFVENTNTDSLAVAIGTSHGAYKRKNKDENLRFDILEKIEQKIPNTPIVLHGASTIPEKFVNTINKFGGKINNAIGIDALQLKFAATKTNICKINIDSDLRLAMTASIRQDLYEHPENFNPRQYLSNTIDNMSNYCAFLMREIMFSANQIKTTKWPEK